MTTTRTPFSSRSLPFRRAAVVLLAGAGVALSPLPAQAHSVGGSGTVVAASAAAASPKAHTAVNVALAQVGKPYAWGGAGPHSFDCSGLTKYAYGKVGIGLPHSSRAQSTIGKPVSRAALRPGDLVFFYSPVSHVGMYIGNGKMVYAPTSGSVVKVGKVDYMPFNIGRRLA